MGEGNTEEGPELGPVVVVVVVDDEVDSGVGTWVS